MCESERASRGARKESRGKHNLNINNQIKCGSRSGKTASFTAHHSKVGEKYMAANRHFACPEGEAQCWPTG